MTAMVIIFARWVQALRDDESELLVLLWGTVTGLACFYMVVAWGWIHLCFQHGRYSCNSSCSTWTVLNQTALGLQMFY